MGIRELFLRPARDAALAARADANVVLVDELLPRRRLAVQDGSSGWRLHAVAPPGRPQGRRVDARALRGQRRPRRDLPADDLHASSCCSCLGVPDDDPEMRWAMKQLDDLMIEEGDTLRLQPCFSPVWDTALALIGAGRRRACRATRPESTTAVRLAARQGSARAPATGAKTVRGVEPGGWFFEYRNGFYPDTDDTAMVLMALARTGHADARRGAAGGPRGRSTGCWRCRTATAAGRPSTATSTTRS